MAPCWQLWTYPGALSTEQEVADVAVHVLGDSAVVYSEEVWGLSFSPPYLFHLEILERVRLGGAGG